jgi:DNA-binding CsgD family transcriptional regulator
MTTELSTPQLPVRKLSYVYLIVVLLILLFDVRFNPYEYPVCSHHCKTLLLLVQALLLICLLLRWFNGVVAVAVSSYFITGLLYLPFFIEQGRMGADIQFSFFNLGSTLGVLMVAAIMLPPLHVLLLGVINFLGMALTLLFARYWGLDLQEINPLVILLSLGIIIAIIGASYYLRNRPATGQQLPDESAEVVPDPLQEREIVELTVLNDYLKLEVNQSGQFIETLSDEMGRIYSVHDHGIYLGRLSELQKMCTDFIRQHIKSENARWLEDTDCHFTAILLSRFPDLTRQELRICSLLRMNMTTKEIAARLHVSEETISEHRKNIRRKLGLSNCHDKKIYDFLQGI